MPHILMNTPRSLDLDITTRCNLRCKYCYHFDSAGDVSNDLPTEEWLEFFKDLESCSIIYVCIAGGEPFCRDDLRELIAGLVSCRTRYSILTNGTLVSDEMAKYLSSTNRCECIQVSIDGSTSAIHDSFRGAGTFQKAITGIKHLQRYKLPVTVRVTIHKENLMDLEEIASMLLEEMGLASFSTNSVAYTGSCKENAKDLLLTPEERSYAIETMLKLDRKYEGRISANAGPLNDGKRWNEMINAKSQRKTKLPNGGFLTGCGCTWNKLAVRADGVIVPCSLLSHMELGKINRNSLRSIWLHNPELKRLRERMTIPLSSFEFCKGCDYRNYCTGNCPAISYTYFGEVNHPSPDMCLKRFQESGGKIQISEKVDGSLYV
jgi:SynChlorMet cassette radical SAM/SPASM protein ScmE